MTILWQLLQILIRTFLPALMEQAQDTAEDGQTPGSLEKRLWQKIREDGWHV